MSTVNAGPRSGAPDAPRIRWWKRWLLAPVVLVLCAVVPWLVPWPWQDPTESADGPIAPTVGQPAAPGSDPRPGATPEGPTDETVERLGKRVAGQAEAYDLPVDRAEVRGVSTEPGPYERLGRIAIPRVGLDVPFGEGVFAETLERGPGHWPGTPLPGRAGNSVISGHRNTNTQPFKRIDELDPGDTITVTSGRSRTTYTVQDTTIVPEREYREFVLRQPKAARSRQLTIFACHPEGNPVFRIVVRAAARAA